MSHDRPRHHILYIICYRQTDSLTDGGGGGGQKEQNRCHFHVSQAV